MDYHHSVKSESTGDIAEPANIHCPGLQVGKASWRWEEGEHGFAGPR